MKIVKKGTKPLPYWCGTWRCGSCGTIYEVGPEDESKVKYDDDQRDGETLQIQCDVCEQKTYLYRHAKR